MGWLQRIAGALMAWFVGDVVASESAYNLPKGVTHISRSIYELHMIILGVCAAIGCAVFGVMLYSLVKHRKSRGHVAATFHESVTVEVIWTVIPFFILVGMAIPATKVLRDMHNTESSELTVQVVGYQWKWRYDYPEAAPGESLSFFSNLVTTQEQIHNRDPKGEHYLREVDNPLVLPANKKVRLLFTSNDVIHAWWVPEFGIKKDTIPGFVNESWVKVEKPGIYRGQCAELCGINHAYMPIVVDVKPEDEFQAWLEAKLAQKRLEKEASSMVFSKEELMSRGQSVYDKVCVACHQADGAGLPPVFPSLKGTDMVLHDLPGHVHTVLYGKPGTAMQAFGEQLSDADIAAVVTYERNAFGNDTGDVIQPLDVVMAKAASD